MPFVYKYPHPAVTTDCVILTFHQEHLKILLIRRGIEPFKGSWALPGGFLRMDESAEEGALRELREETGVTCSKIKQFYTFSAPGRDPRERVITIAFYALIKWQHATGADDADEASWINLDSLPPLAFDHKEIVEKAMEAIRKDIFFEPVGFELLNDVFSMSELQKVYEAILGKEFDRRNFAKKMKHLSILEEVEEVNPPAEDASLATTSFNAEMPILAEPVDRELPLPFLNQPDMDFSINNDVSFTMPDSQPVPKPSRRKSLWFRLNRQKYDELKDDDKWEF